MIFWLEKRRLISFVLTLLIAIEIFFFSSLNSSQTPKSSVNVSIIYHFTVFFLFSFFLFLAIKGNKDAKKKYVLIVLFISFVYAALDELHQLFTPGRDVSIKDILTDISGSIFSMIIYFIYSKKNKAKEGLIKSK